MGKGKESWRTRTAGLPKEDSLRNMCEIQDSTVMIGQMKRKIQIKRIDKDPCWRRVRTGALSRTGGVKKGVHLDQPL